MPKAAVEAADLRDGDEVAITDEAGTLRIVRADRIDIRKLVASITPETLHRDDAWLDGTLMGHEIW